MGKTAMVLLAAGNSSRMGAVKQLLDYQGRPLLRHAAQVALAAGGDPVIAVLGANAEALTCALSGLPVTVATNPLWAEGMGTSIHAGVRAVLESGADALVLLLADQPLIPSEFLRLVVDTHQESRAPIVAARYAGTAGVPVLFARSYFDRLLSLAPRLGCKGLILGNPDETVLLDCPQAEFDIDTPADYARLGAPL